MERIWLLAGIGEIAPSSVKDYESIGGYSALRKAVINPDTIITTISASGLRGRSGSGFPTGKKWSITQQVSAAQKYVICNADEGEPGTGKDRVLLSGKPHAILEGMIIAGIAVGATQGYLYLRGEYTDLLPTLNHALSEAKNAGYCGQNILGSEYCFDITIRCGAGSYLCGEETALIESIEGNRPEARQKPPYPGVQGLWGMPTLINNAETLANIPIILDMGADQFRQYRTVQNPGTKLVTLSGCVRRPGVYEIPLGMPIRQIFEEFGGGCPDGKQVEAVQTGGLSGPFLSAEHLDTPFDIESCRDVGATLGVGDLMFIAADTDLLVLSKNITHFFVEESCGRCTPCRCGLPRIEEILDLLIGGHASKKDISELESILSYISSCARCALGRAAVTPIRSLFEQYRAVFDTHISKETWKMGCVEWNNS